MSRSRFSPLTFSPMHSVTALLARMALAGVATVGLLASGATAARSFTLGGPITAQQFDALNPTVAHSAESRWGSGSAGGNTFELDIHRINESGGFINDAQAEFDWVSGTAVGFSLVFDGAILTYTVGDQVLATTTDHTRFSDIFIRAAARKEGSSLLLSQLSLTDGDKGGALPTLNSACRNGTGCGFFDAQYLHITDVSGAFTLTGWSTLTWDPDHLPRQSNLAYQIKLVPGDVDTPSTPEPNALLGLVLLSVAGLRRALAE